MWDGFSTRPPPKAAAVAAADGLRTRPTYPSYITRPVLAPPECAATLARFKLESI
jgi:hypothetical protein